MAVALSLVALGTGCNGSGSPTTGRGPVSSDGPIGVDSSTTGTTTLTGTGVAGDPVEAVRQSRERLLAARSFRFVREKRSDGAFAGCRAAETVAGTIDLDRQIATYDLVPGGPSELVITKDTYFVRGAALPGWTLDRPWLAVPFDDAGPTVGSDAPLARLFATTGVTLRPGYWSGTGAGPGGTLRLLRDGLTAAVDRGPEVVRDVDTTRYDLTIDRTMLVGSVAATSTTRPSAPLDPATARANRQSFLDRFAEDLPGGPPAPDVVASYLDGDTGALIHAQERTTGTTMAPDLRALVEQLSLVDNADVGLTMGPMAVASIGMTASAWVDHQGLLRRLDVAVDLFGRNPFTGTTVKPTSSTNSSERVEFVDIGVPVTTTAPPTSDVEALTALPASAMPPGGAAAC